ncbi:hypothetical protein [Pseudoalteromonas umbrosa]|uniref:hypothetical protein n=1 Tax=Pseudoalteromonas umbrosa TaxID=3048489 RepID=UPI0024C26667|nr:hypothetical protein [Pseudoalteromonas sp. B95]MDK1290213.1 hypothetical protein [Pseudoalteromonas sp. B95]
MNKAQQIINKYKELSAKASNLDEHNQMSERQTISEFVIAQSTRLDERRMLQTKFIAGTLPREAEFWHMRIKDLLRLMGSKKLPKVNTIQDIVLWVTRAAEAWRNSLQYAELMKKKGLSRKDKNTFVWVEKKR